MGMSLYQINEQIEELTERLVFPETGEIDEEVLAELDQLDIDLDEKLENYGVIMKQLWVEAEALIAESKNLKRRAEVKMNKYDRMSELVTRVLHGQPKELTRVKFGFRPSASVEIINEELVPDTLCRFETVRKPVKADIKKLLDSGQEVPGCVLVKKKNLQIDKPKRNKEEK